MLVEHSSRRVCLAAISEIRVGMGVFSADHAPIGTVHVIDNDRITLLGARGSRYEGGHYQAAMVLIGSVQERRVVLSKDAEAALILEEAYSEVSSNRSTSRYPRPHPSTAAVVGMVLLCAMAVSAIPFVFGGRKRTETRRQRADEAATMRFRMEDDGAFGSVGTKEPENTGTKASSGDTKRSFQSKSEEKPAPSARSTGKAKAATDTKAAKGTASKPKAASSKNNERAPRKKTSRPSSSGSSNER